MFPAAEVATTAPEDDSTTAPIDDSTPAPVDDSTPAPVDDSTAAPVDNSTPAPVEDSTPAPVDDSTPTPVDDPNPAPVAPVEGEENPCAFSGVPYQIEKERSQNLSFQVTLFPTLLYTSHANTRRRSGLPLEEISGAKSIKSNRAINTIPAQPPGRIQQASRRPLFVWRGPVASHTSTWTFFVPACADRGDQNASVTSLSFRAVVFFFFFSGRANNVQQFAPRNRRHERYRFRVLPDQLRPGVWVVHGRTRLCTL